MVSAHPTSEHLEAYVNGSLSDGMSLLVASHLTYCAQCRREVARLEALAGSVFKEIPGEACAAPSIEGALAMLDAPEVEREAAPMLMDDVLPHPILKILGSTKEEIRWKFRLPGVHEHVVDGFGEESVSLLRVRPGRTMPQHTHEGEEATLILSGRMQDGAQEFVRGDVALADHNHDHHPEVVGDEVCFCLIVMSGSLKFTGTLGRALNLFTR